MDTWHRNNGRRGQYTLPQPLAALPLRPAKRAPPTLLATWGCPPSPLLPSPPASLPPSFRLSLHPSPSPLSFLSTHLPPQAPLEAEGSRRLPFARSCDFAAGSPPPQAASGFSWQAVTLLARCLFFFQGKVSTLANLLEKSYYMLPAVRQIGTLPDTNSGQSEP